jgi:hypothetical protein
MEPQSKYKLLDCDRKDILGLPSGAVHLWLTYYMHESEARESYLSLRTIADITGMDQKTIIKWQRYLKAGGWLIETGATAADRYSKPTRGAHKVPVVRVDDPTKGAGNIPAVEIPTKLESCGAGESLAPKNSSKGYGYDSEVIGSSSASPSGSRCGDEYGLTHACDATPKKRTEEQTQNLKTNTNTKTKYVRCAKDGTPWPNDFDSWTNAQRTEWLLDHDPTGVGTSAPTRAALIPPEQDPDSIEYMPPSMKADMEELMEAELIGAKLQIEKPPPNRDWEDSESQCIAAAGVKDRCDIPCTNPVARLYNHPRHKEVWPLCQEHWDKFLAKGWVQEEPEMLRPH